MEKLINKPDINFKKVKKLVFLFILLIIIELIIFSKIKIEFQNIQFSSEAKPHLKNSYSILLKWCIFSKLPIVTIKIDKKKLEKWKVKDKLEEAGTKLVVDRNQFDKNFFKLSKTAIKSLKFESSKLDLEVEYGTENAALTAILLPFFSTLITLFIQNKQNKCKKIMPYYFKMQPVFKNQNIIKFSFSGIFELKMIHIINTICMLIKKRRVEKHERTSHRGSYDYSYE